MCDALIMMVEDTAAARGEPSVPRDFISEAIDMIERNEVEVRRYPNGIPSLKAVYDIAVELKNKITPS